MSLEQVFFLSQSIAAVGVVASLIFVGFQVRDSARAVRSATTQAVHENFSSWYILLAHNPGALATSLKGFADLCSMSPAETAQFNCTFLAFLSHSQNAFHQWRQGHLASDQWACWEALLMNMVHTPGGVAFWRQRSYIFAPDFGREVTEIIGRTPHAGTKSFGVLAVASVSPAPVRADAPGL
jgi:hypothetical protein